jgi:hypothetical protein
MSKIEKKTKSLTFFCLFLVVVVEINFYWQTFLGNANEKCQHGGGGKWRRRQRQESMESTNWYYFISTPSTIYPTLVLIV